MGVVAPYCFRIPIFLLFNSRFVLSKAQKMNWNDLLNSTEFHALVGGAVTAFIAWLRRKLEIDKINQKHAADLQDLRDTYEARMLEKDSIK